MTLEMRIPFRKTRIIPLVLLVCISLYITRAVISTYLPITHLFVPPTRTRLKADPPGKQSHPIIGNDAPKHGATVTGGDESAEKVELVACNNSPLTSAGSPLTCGLPTNNARNTVCKIAMGCAITTKKVKGPDRLKTESPFFKHLLPSFCRTASDGFAYTFIIAYDFNDAILNKSNGRQVFRDAFDDTVEALCNKSYTVVLTFLECNHSKKPAWAQNDALLKGYRDNMDYLYMVNDDTIMETGGWAPAFVKALAKMTPPNVGLVGPQHRGGPTTILTYHFVHRTHIDIFGYFYPRNYTDWYGDNWISDVYRPHNTRKVEEILVRHTRETGTRYERHKMTRHAMSSILISTHDHLRKTIKAACNLNVDEQFPKKTLDTKTIKTLDTETKKTSDTETKKTLDTKTNKTLDTKTIKTLDTETKKTSDTKTKKTLNTKTNKTLDTKTKKTLDTKTNKTLDTKTEKTLDTKTNKTLDTKTKKILDSETKKTLDTKTEKTLDTKTKKTLDTKTKKILDTKTKKISDTKTEKTLDTKTKKTLDTKTKETLDTKTKKILDTETEKTLDTKTEKTLDTKTKKTLDTKTKKTLDTKTKKTLDTKAKKILDTKTEKTLDTKTEKTLDTKTKKALDTKTEKTLDTKTEKTLDTKTEKTLDT